ncbi:ACP S-malonyltransferase [Noviherbaspirillum sp. ST9]|uniref:ACP S-malonyltransferase n=1 Tax=Noviherbaspirillum sp. ST9 TaxID=3401606 RepID=UPI003B58B0BF
MLKRLAILCPGQGGQHSRMFEFAHRDAQTRDWLASSPLESELGMPVDVVLNDGTQLFANRFAQPLMVASAASTWNAIRDLVPAPALVAGYSIGELSAYAVAGSLDAGAAVALAGCRARLMDECASEATPQQLVAVSGMSTARLGAFLPDDALFIAIETGDDSAIIGGDKAAAEILSGKLRAMGCRVSVLPVGVASHTPYMNAAASRFLAEMRQHRFAPPVFPVVAGISGRLVFGVEDAQATLASQIANTIRWKDCMDSCAEAGITIALELGPGTALSRMLRERHPYIECRAIDEFRSAEGVARWVGRHFD